MPLTAPQPAYTTTVSLTDASTADGPEACTFVSGVDPDKVYQVTNAAKHVWDPTVPVVVKDGGVTVATNLYSFNYLTGTVTFTGHAVTGAITVTGNYLPIMPFANASKWEFNAKATIVDTSNFDGTGAVERTPTVIDFDGTIEAFDTTQTVLDGVANTVEAVFYGQIPFVLSMYLNGIYFRCFALFESPKTSSSVADVIKTSMSWKMATLNPAVPSYGWGS